jgi:hydrophobic/amphiphilic exporter-1 (mainly G- bacteria), HAE1 family
MLAASSLAIFVVPVLFVMISKIAFKRKNKKLAVIQNL